RPLRRPAASPALAQRLWRVLRRRLAPCHEHRPRGRRVEGAHGGRLTGIALAAPDPKAASFTRGSASGEARALAKAFLVVHLLFVGAFGSALWRARRGR